MSSLPIDLLGSAVTAPAQQNTSTQSWGIAGSSTGGITSVGSLSGSTISGTTVSSTGAVSPLYFGSVNQRMTLSASGSLGIGGVTNVYTSNGSTVKPSIFTIATAKGNITIYGDGSIEFPEDVDESAKEFLEQMKVVYSDTFRAAVRIEAAKQVRKHLPDILNDHEADIEPYARHTIPMDIARRIEEDLS